MKRTLICLLLILMVIMVPMSAMAADITVVVPEQATPSPDTVPQSLYPSGVWETEENGRREIIKSYALEPHDNPADIPRESFIRGGFLYELADIVKKETASVDVREHIETISVQTATKDTDSILKSLDPTIEYTSDDGYVGVLTLDIGSIRVESAGTKTNNYTLSATRKYPQLPSNDPSLIPQTVKDGGKTLTLTDIQWKEHTVSVDNEDIPQTYTATATYTAQASKTVTIGYHTTADYRGEIANVFSGRTVFTAYFIGIPIVAPVVQKQAQPVPTPEPDATEPETPEPTVTQSPQPTEEPIETSTESPTESPTELPTESTTEEPLEDEPESEEQPFNPISIVLFVVAILAGIAIGFFYRKSRNKNIVSILLVAVIVASFSVPSFAYSFEGTDYSFGVQARSVTQDSEIDETNVAENNSPPPLPPKNDEKATIIQKPTYYKNGSMGTLKIPKIKLSVKVYHGETTANMKKGAAHFKNTSAWDGNVAFAGHNRGSSAYFGKLKNLSVGDKITYTTKYGTRTYKITTKRKISSTNTSVLDYSTSNKLTLITCVENVPTKRWCIQATEIKS